MNISGQQFQDKLDEIGKAYENAKDAILNLRYPIDQDCINRNADQAYENIRKLRDLAATALQAQFMLKEN